MVTMVGQIMVNVVNTAGRLERDIIRKINIVCVNGWVVDSNGTLNAGLTDTRESSIRGMKRISCTIKIDVSRGVLDVLMTVLHEYAHVIVRAMVAECTYPGPGSGSAVPVSR